MKYIDQDGDVWEEQGDALVCVSTDDEDFRDVERSRSDVEASFGPLHPYEERDESDLPTVDDVMDRAAVFQSAHALVQGLEWDEKASVYDVLQVAKWLEGEG